MKSMMNASLGFGLVNLECKIYKATETHDVQFHLHHVDCGGAVGMKRYCKSCDDTLAPAEIVKGVDRGGKLVTLSTEELSDVEESAGGKHVEVLQFVHADEVDPITFESPYYLEPTAASLEGYTLLRVVLEESDRVGVVRYTMRGKTRMAMLRAQGNVLVLHNIVWPDEVRTPDFKILDKKVALKPLAVKVAHQLVESMMGVFDPEAFTDEYTMRLNEAIDAKAAGDDSPAISGVLAEAEVHDLLAALEASVKRPRKTVKRSAK